MWNSPEGVVPGEEQTDRLGPDREEGLDLPQLGVVALERAYRDLCGGPSLQRHRPHLLQRLQVRVGRVGRLLPECKRCSEIETAGEGR